MNFRLNDLHKQIRFANGILFFVNRITKNIKNTKIIQPIDITMELQQLHQH
jgi:hypothetical protein